jgi:glucan phosphoethanolaminetransferase (alkaline phosphatase superfamily)
MNDLVNVFQNLNQEQAVVAVFAGVLIVSVAVIALTAVLRFLGKWGIVAALVSLGSVLIAYRMIR